MSNERHIRPVFAEGVGYPRDARSDSGSDRGPSGASMGARPAPPSDEQLTPRQQARLAQMPESMRGTYRRALSTRSLAAAVKVQCFECCGWNRAAVRTCTDDGCPLHSHRPGRRRAAKEQACLE